MNFQQPVVTIPNLTHTTIEQILSINAHIIKILCQYQNYGWLEEPEYKIYQARLQANLTYLATAADYMGKPDPAKLALLINPPNLAAVGYPEKLKQQKKAAMSEAGSNSGSSSRLNTGITMAMDPNIGDVTDAANVATDYKPVPPFSLNGPLPPGIPQPILLNPQDTKKELERRLGGAL